MFICRNCGMTYSHQAKFCERCGSAVVDSNYSEPFAGPAYSTPPQNVAPAYNTSYAPQNTAVSYDPYNSYAPQAEAPISGAGKPLGIIGMALGIFNIVMSFFSFIASCGAIDMASDYDYYYDFYNYHEDEITAIFFFTFILLATSIVGLVLSSISRNKGFVSGMSKTGKILGILSTIFNAIACFLAIIALGIVA